MKDNGRQNRQSRIFRALNVYLSPKRTSTLNFQIFHKSFPLIPDYILRYAENAVSFAGTGVDLFCYMAGHIQGQAHFRQKEQNRGSSIADKGKCDPCIGNRIGHNRNV